MGERIYVVMSILLLVFAVPGSAVVGQGQQMLCDTCSTGIDVYRGEKELQILQENGELCTGLRLRFANGVCADQSLCSIAYTELFGYTRATGAGCPPLYEWSWGSDSFCADPMAELVRALAKLSLPTMSIWGDSAPDRIHTGRVGETNYHAIIKVDAGEDEPISVVGLPSGAVVEVEGSFPARVHIYLNLAGVTPGDYLVVARRQSGGWRLLTLPVR